MAKLDIKLNSNIELIYEDKTYKTTVQHVDDEEFAFVIINNEGVYLIFQEGTKLEVKVYSDTCIYCFDTKITRRTSGSEDENIPMFYLAMPTEIKRIQRRKYVRAFFTEEFSFFQLSDKSSTSRKNIVIDVSSQDAKKGITLDMSGGGIRFISPVELEENSVILMDIQAEKGNVLVEGRVKWSKVDDSKRIICATNFENLPEIERDKLINKTFDVIRRQRRNQ